jgi:hypothetical protein
MALKLTVPMWALPTDNEQSLGAGRTVTTAATATSREFMEFAAFSKAIFILDLSASSGTFTLDMTVQGFNEASGKWHTVVTFPQQSANSGASPLAANSTLVQSSALDFPRYRAQWVTTGTGYSTTFTLVALCHTEEPIARTW